MGTRMSPEDAVWYQGETFRNPMTISSVLWFDGPLDVGILRRRLEDRLLARHPVFRQRIVASRIPGRMPRWEDADDFELEDHLRVVDLPEPGGHALLEARCSLERSTPFDRDRPLWSTTIYQGYRGGGTAVHARIHHSIGDGIALLRLLLTLSNEFAPEAVPLDDAPSHPLVHEVFGLGQGAIRLAAEQVKHPEAVLTATGRVVSAAAWATRLFLPDLVEHSILHGVPQGTKRMSWDPDGYPVDQLKTVGRALGATVNELLLTIAAGAMHRYLAERDALVEDVVMMMPINLRDRDAPLPRQLGNKIALLPVRLPVGSADPAARLAMLQARLQTYQGSPAPWISRALMLGTALATPPLERRFHRFNQLRSTGVITSLPGPVQPLHIGGSRVLGAMGWGGLTANLNLSGSFVGLGGKVFPGFVTDTAITDDPDRLLDHLRDEWHAVLATLAPGDGD